MIVRVYWFFPFSLVLSSDRRDSKTWTQLSGLRIKLLKPLQTFLCLYLYTCVHKENESNVKNTPFSFFSMHYFYFITIIYEGNTESKALTFSLCLCVSLSVSVSLSLSLSFIAPSRCFQTSTSVLTELM